MSPRASSITYEAPTPTTRRFYLSHQVVRKQLVALTSLGLDVGLLMKEIRYRLGGRDAVVHEPEHMLHRKHLPVIELRFAYA